MALSWPTGLKNARKQLQDVRVAWVLAQYKAGRMMMIPEESASIIVKWNESVWLFVLYALMLSF